MVPPQAVVPEVARKARSTSKRLKVDHMCDKMKDPNKRRRTSLRLMNSAYFAQCQDEKVSPRQDLGQAMAFDKEDDGTDANHPSIVCEPPTPMDHKTKQFSASQSIPTRTFTDPLLDHPGHWTSIKVKAVPVSAPTSPWRALGTVTDQEAALEGHLSLSPGLLSTSVDSFVSTESYASSSISPNSTRYSSVNPLNQTLLPEMPLTSSIEGARSKKKKKSTGELPPSRRPGVSHARKTAPGHIKRPRNAYILFRSHTVSQGLIPQEVEKDHRNISRIISHMWKSLPEEERRSWEEEALREKEEHRLKYPDYKYKPVSRPGVKGTRNVKRVQGAEEVCEEIADIILKAHGREGVVKMGAAAKSPDKLNLKDEGKGKKAKSSKSSKKGAASSSAKAKPVPNETEDVVFEEARRKGAPSVLAQQANAGLTLLGAPGSCGWESAQTFWHRRASSAPPMPVGFSALEGEEEFIHPAEALNPDHCKLTSINHQASSIFVSAPFGKWPTSPGRSIDQRGSAGSSEKVPAEDGLHITTATNSSLKQTPQRKARPPPFLISSPKAPDFSIPMQAMLSPTTIPAELGHRLSRAPSFLRPHTADFPTPVSATFRPGLQLASVTADAMLISPMKSAFSEVKRPSIGWDSWSRVMAGDVAYSGLREPFGGTVISSRNPSFARPSSHLAHNNDVSAEDGTQLFTDATEAAVVSFQDEGVLTDTHQDPFTFGPEFLNQVQEDNDQATTAPGTAMTTSTRSLQTPHFPSARSDEGDFHYKPFDDDEEAEGMEYHPPSRSYSDQALVKGFWEEHWNQQQLQQQHYCHHRHSHDRHPAGDGSMSALARRRSTIIGFKNAIEAAVERAAEQRLFDGSNDADEDPRHVLLRRLRASISFEQPEEGSFAFRQHGLSLNTAGEVEFDHLGRSPTASSPDSTGVGCHVSGKTSRGSFCQLVRRSSHACTDQYMGDEDRLEWELYGHVGMPLEYGSLLRDAFAELDSEYRDQAADETMSPTYGRDWLNSSDSRCHHPSPLEMVEADLLGSRKGYQSGHECQRFLETILDSSQQQQNSDQQAYERSRGFHKPTQDSSLSGALTIAPSAVSEGRRRSCARSWTKPASVTKFSSSLHHSNGWS